MLSLWIVACLAVELVNAAPVTSSQQSTMLNDGSSFQSGSVSNTLKWEASGVLEHGTPPSGVLIEDCYYMYLADEGMLAGTDPEKQRIELYSFPYTEEGSSWSYTWSSFLSPGFSTSTHFFHLWQLFRRDRTQGPVFTLDAIDGDITIIDARTQTQGPSTSLDSFIGVTIQHSLKVTFGISGSLTYQAVDVVSGEILLSYQAKGDVGSQASIKFGTYRLTVEGMSDVTNYVGDYSTQRVG